MLSNKEELLTLRHVVDEGADEYKVIMLHKGFLNFKVIKVSHGPLSTAREQGERSQLTQPSLGQRRAWPAERGGSEKQPASLGSLLELSPS